MRPESDPRQPWATRRCHGCSCRYVAGRVHEVGLKFDQPVDESQLFSHGLSASILIVDDDEDVLQLAASVLREAGAMVATADRGFRALKQISQNDFDLVLMDIRMPGIDGLAVVKTLRERGFIIPIIAFTASEDPAVRAACLTAGYDDFLLKPVDKTTLIDAVLRYLGAEQPRLSHDHTQQ